MEQQKISGQLAHYNRMYKEMDDVYHSLANHFGLSDTAMWLLYILRESQTPLTQSSISEKLALSKQTIHSALKKLETAGFVALGSSAGSQKNKLIHLTAAGESLARHTVDHVIKMEQNAFCQLAEDERKLFLQLNQKYLLLLQQQAETLLAAT